MTVHTYNYPGSSSFQAVELADKSAATKQAVNAWWSETHQKNGPCAPGGGAIYTKREAQRAKYRDGSKVFNLQTLAIVFAPDRVPAGFPLAGWKLVNGEGYTLHVIDA